MFTLTGISGCLGGFEPGGYDFLIPIHPDAGRLSCSFLLNIDHPIHFGYTVNAKADSRENRP